MREQRKEKDRQTDRGRKGVMGKRMTEREEDGWREQGR